MVEIWKPWVFPLAIFSIQCRTKVKMAKGKKKLALPKSVVEKQLNNEILMAGKQKEQANPPERSMYSDVCFYGEADYRHTRIKGPTLILCLHQTLSTMQLSDENSIANVNADNDQESCLS